MGKRYTFRVCTTSKRTRENKTTRIGTLSLRTPPSPLPPTLLLLIVVVFHLWFLISLLPTPCPHASHAWCAPRGSCLSGVIGSRCPSIPLLALDLPLLTPCRAFDRPLFPSNETFCLLSIGGRLLTNNVCLSWAWVLLPCSACFEWGECDVSKLLLYPLRTRHVSSSFPTPCLMYYVQKAYYFCNEQPSKLLIYV